MRRRHRMRYLRGTIIATIAVSLIAPMWIIELVLIDRKRTLEGLIARTWSIKPIIAVLSARKRTTARIIPAREQRLPSTVPQSVQCRLMQHRLRVRLPSVQPRSTTHVKVRDPSHLTMSTMRSHPTNQQAAPSTPQQAAPSTPV